MTLKCDGKILTSCQRILHPLQNSSAMTMKVFVVNLWAQVLIRMNPCKLGLITYSLHLRPSTVPTPGKAQKGPCSSPKWHCCQGCGFSYTCKWWQWTGFQAQWMQPCLSTGFITGWSKHTSLSNKCIITEKWIAAQFSLVQPKTNSKQADPGCPLWHDSCSWDFLWCRGHSNVCCKSLGFILTYVVVKVVRS